MIAFPVELAPENNANNTVRTEQASQGRAEAMLERTPTEPTTGQVEANELGASSPIESVPAHRAPRSKVTLAIASESGQRPYMEDASAGIQFARAGSDGTHWQGQVLVVCDGVGGQQGGAAASNLTIPYLARELHAFLMNEETPDVIALLETLEHRFTQANDNILHLAQREPALSDMATTAVVGVIAGSVLGIGWAGDSRAYLWRRGSISRLTADHAVGGRSHQITQYLGKPAEFQPSFRALELQPGDTVLLVTDGVTDVLSDDDLGDLVTEFRLVGADAVARAIADSALEAGTTDNVTVLCSFHEGDSSQCSPRA